MQRDTDTDTGIIDDGRGAEEWPRRRVIVMGNDEEHKEVMVHHLRHNFDRVFDVVSLSQACYVAVTGQSGNFPRGETAEQRVRRFATEHLEAFPVPYVVVLHNAADSRTDLVWTENLYAALQCLAVYTRVFVVVAGDNQEIWDNWGKDILEWEIANVVSLKGLSYLRDRGHQDALDLGGRMLCGAATPATTHLCDAASPAATHPREEPRPGMPTWFVVLVCLAAVGGVYGPGRDLLAWTLGKK